MSAEALPAPAGAIVPESLPSLADRYRSGDDAAWTEVRGVLTKADKGDRDAARKVGRLMGDAPNIADLTACDIAYAVECSMVRKTSGADALGTAEAARLKL